MPGARATAAGNFLLELQGTKGGFLRSVEGGNIKAEVVREEGRARGAFVKKHLGETTVEPFAITLGLGLDRTVYAWLSEAWTGKQKPRNGAIVSADANFNAKQRREFAQALITEVGFPASDAGSKEAAFLTVRFAPETVSSKKASGKVQAAATARTKSWLPSNFRLEIDGLDCKKVNKIDAFTVKCAAPVDFPDLRITLAETSAQTWIDWHQSFVVAGDNSDRAEKNGKIVLLAQNLKDVLGEIRLFGLGIYRLAPQKQEAGSEVVQHVVANLYCERMEFELKQTPK